MTTDLETRFIIDVYGRARVIMRAVHGGVGGCNIINYKAQSVNEEHRRRSTRQLKHLQINEVG